MNLFSQDILAECAGCGPEIFLTVSLLALMLWGSFKGDSQTRSLMYTTLAVVIITLLSLEGSPVKYNIFFHGLFIWDFFGLFFKTLILGGMALILYVSVSALEREDVRRFEYPLLVLLTTLGMMIMVSSHDLMTLYLSLELQSLPLYVLVALKRERLIATEAAIKYFILGAVASVFILYGSSFLYGMTGTTEFEGLSIALRSTSSSLIMLKLGLGLVLAGLAFKLALAPFHMWSPDVYEGSITPVTMIVATLPKLAILAVIMRLGGILSEELLIFWEQLLMGLAALSMIVGSIGAFFQQNLKRLLGYSAVSHMGYAFLGLLDRTPEGYQNTLVYSIIYLVMTLGMFATLLNLRKGGRTADYLSDLAGLSQTKPVLAASMAIFLFSLAGIPPLAGFFAKLGVFEHAIQAGYENLVILGVLTSVISAAYYLKIIKTLYFESVDLGSQEENSSSISSLDTFVLPGPYSVMIVSAVFILLYFLSPAWLEEATQEVIKALLNKRAL